MLAYADAVLWDPALADDGLWQALHAHFTEPELVELGFILSVTVGGQHWVRTLQVEHNEFLAGTSAGLAPHVAVTDEAP